jgi:hypothetical protein
MLEKEKLNGTNFVGWNRNLRIVLRQEKKEYVLDTPYPDEPQNVAHNTSAYRAYVKHTDDAVDVQCLMLACMNSELQKQYETTNPHDMIVGCVACLKTRQGLTGLTPRRPYLVASLLKVFRSALMQSR